MDNKFKFLTGYSLKKRICKKSFIITNVIICILILLMTNLFNIINFFGGDFKESVSIVLFDETNKNAGEYFMSIADEDKESFNFEISVETDYSEEKKTSLVDEGKTVVLLRINDKGYIYSDVYTNDLSLTNENNLRILSNSVKTYYWVLDHGDISQELEDFNSSQPMVITRPEDNDTEQEDTILGGIAIFLVMPIFFLLLMLLQMIGTDIVEEKSSRAIEIIISNVPPVTHFSSKITSAVLFMVIQGGLLLCYTFVGGLIAMLIGNSMNVGIAGGQDIMGSVVLDTILAKIPLLVLIAILFTLAGLVMYLVLMAVLSSMANSMESLQSFSAPLMILLLIGFYTGIFGLQLDGAIFMKIMGFIPFFSPLLAPALYFTGTFGVLELCISFVILVATTALVLYLGVPIYKASILDYSDMKLLKKLKQAIKKAKYVD